MYDSTAARLIAAITANITNQITIDPVARIIGTAMAHLAAICMHGPQKMVPGAFPPTKNGPRISS
jgi:hypothetical protein